jgi:hypothetical protein
MSLSPDELMIMKNRANEAIKNVEKNLEAGLIAVDVLMLLLHLKMSQGERRERTKQN